MKTNQTKAISKYLGIISIFALAGFVIPKIAFAHFPQGGQGEGGFQQGQYGNQGYNQQQRPRMKKEKLERMLENNPELLTQLDLNGDGVVDGKEAK